MATKKKAAAPNPADGAVSLKVLAERKEVEGVGKRTSYSLDPLILETEPGFNGRKIVREKIERFKEAKRNGAIFPDTVVRVDNGRVFMVDGHHRNIADRELIAEGFPILSTPCIEFKSQDVAERILYMMGANDQDGLTPLELGIQYKKLHEVCGWPVAKIAAKRGYSAQHVNDMLALANSSGDVQAMVERGEVAGATALKLVKKHGSGAGKVLADGMAAAKAAGKTKMTGKHVPKSELGNSYVAEVKARAKHTATHLKAMLDSTTVDDATRAAVGAVLAQMKIKVDTAPPPPVNAELNLACSLAAGKTPAAPIVPSGSQVRTWLMSYGASPDAVLRDAAGVLFRAMSGVETLPLSMHEAVDMEMKSSGSVMAETLCPHFAEQISFLRSTGAV